jgi:hypothetical protein
MFTNELFAIVIELVILRTYNVLPPTCFWLPWAIVDIVVGGRSQANNGRVMDALLSCGGGASPSIPGQPSNVASPTLSVVILPPVSSIYLFLF